jgi:hypothetical protein
LTEDEMPPMRRILLLAYVTAVVTLCWWPWNAGLLILPLFRPVAGAQLLRTFREIVAHRWFRKDRGGAVWTCRPSQ